ncbi:MAG: hypothetical protein WED00_00290 [Aquisalimonadaceae bacterium]
MEAELEQKIRLLFKEAYQRKLLIASAFLVICLLVTGAGVFWPKSFASSTTLLVEEKNIIDPQAANRPDRPDAADQVRNVRQILSSRTLLEPLLRAGGWVNDGTTPLQLEEHLDAFQRRITVESPASNLVRITFNDGDPERAYRTTRRLGALVIERMHGARLGQSRAAYAFIDRQVQAYGRELKESRAMLDALREQSPLAHPGAEEQAAERAARLQEQVDNLVQQLREARITERTLSAQLSGEADSAATGGGGSIYGQQLAELRERLRQLRLVYTDSYPDVIGLRQEIAELESAAAQARDGGQGGGLSAGDRQRLISERARDNPVFQQLQQELYETRTLVERLDTRLASQQERLLKAREQERQAQALRDQVERLTRDHAMNRDIHQDLLRRRENARVSMTLDDEQQPFTLRVSEPAYLPHQPSGPRLLQFAAGSVVAGASVPLSLLFLFLLIDPRVRTDGGLPEPCARRLLEVIPHVSTRRERLTDGFKLAVTLFIVMFGIGGVLAILALRYFGQL